MCQQLHRLFSRIREHEKLVEEGRDPVEVERQRAIGTFDEDYHGDTGESAAAYVL